MAYGYIYKITNKINSKVYIGLTKNGFKQRYSGSIKATHNKHLQHSIEKYGIENFEIIEEFDFADNEQELKEKEKYYIQFFKSNDPKYGYNKTSGGEHPVPNEQAKKKMSDAKKGKTYGEKTKQLWSEQRTGQGNPNFGKRWDDEHKQKIAASVSKSTRGELNPMYGKKHSDESKAKMSNKAKNRKHSQETKQKMSETRKGCNNANSKKVLCVETGIIFNTIKEAKEWCGAPAIGQCCRGNVSYSGKHPLTGEKLHWKFIE